VFWSYDDAPPSSAHPGRLRGAPPKRRQRPTPAESPASKRSIEHDDAPDATAERESERDESRPPE